MKERRYWQAEFETAPVERLKQIQDEKARSLVKRAYEKTSFYRKKFDTAGVRPEDIKSLADFHSLPLTRYLEDFVATAAEEKLAIPKAKVVNIMSTSGTVSGSPQLAALSESDLDTWAMIISRFALMCGLEEEDILAMFLIPFKIVEIGMERAGVSVIPVTHVTTRMDNAIKLINNAKATAILSSPSLLLAMRARAQELGIDYKKIGLRKAILGGESWSDSYRRRMAQELGIEFYDLYGLAEVGHCAGECGEGDGLHCWDDLFIVEIIDPETEKVLPAGELGEIVVTPLWREAMPLIRYCTGDAARLLEYKPCSCGRTLSKISRIKGRISTLIKVGKTKLFPIDVEEVLHSIPELSGEYQIILSHPEVQEMLEIKAECNLGVELTDMLQRKVETQMEQSLGAKSKVSLVRCGQFPKGIDIKAQRIVKSF